jgi:hypothetical protein
MSEKKGTPITVDDDFVKEYLRRIIITKGNARRISDYLKRARDQHLRSLAETIDEQVEKQGGY